MIAEQISTWLRQYVEDNNLKTLVVGVSGGVDSAVTSALCAMTGLPVVAVNMPLHSSDKNSEMSNLHLQWLCDNFSNVKTDVIPLGSAYDTLSGTLSNYHSDLGFANTKSRLRMVALYQIASSMQGMVVGTGNKVEDFGVGFFTKYGDGGVDISPIADLTKTQVRSLAKELKIDQRIIEAPPTDGLWDDSRTDEDQIGATYEELEWAMDYIDTNENFELTGRQKEVIEIYNKFHQQNSHKMREIPVFKVAT
tara:strand:- start:244 stop:996 length:753 start_codon:yes stop_codon:yes gene_type:complete